MLPFQHPWRRWNRSVCPEEMLIAQAGSAGGAQSREELRFGLLGSGNFPPVAVEPQDHGSSFCTSGAEGKGRGNLTLPRQGVHRAAGIKPVRFWASTGSSSLCCHQVLVGCAGGSSIHGAGPKGEGTWIGSQVFHCHPHGITQTFFPVVLPSLSVHSWAGLEESGCSSSPAADPRYGNVAWMLRESCVSWFSS